MRKALIVWGGWSGHKPQQIANRLGQKLQNKGYVVNSTSNFGVLLNKNLADNDVIIPIWSVGIKGELYLSCLLKAIKEGVGLAAFHGGIKWFEHDEYYQMIGGSYLFDSNPVKCEVKITDSTHYITKGIEDFNIISEQYQVQVDPRNNVLASSVHDGVETPISWTKSYGKGRVFYTSLAHSPEQLFSEPNIDMILRGIDWCAQVRAAMQ